MFRLCACVLCVALAGCGGGGGGGGGVVDTVLQDFGIKDRPSDYVSGADKVYAALNDVGQAEMKRLNFEDRHGQVKFEDAEGIRGKYYKEVKVYESFHPIDANATGRTAGSGTRGFAGYLEFGYRYFQGARKSNRTEAEAEVASIPTDNRGRETYRYHFNSAGHWMGGEGEPVNK